VGEGNDPSGGIKPPTSPKTRATAYRPKTGSMRPPRSRRAAQHAQPETEGHFHRGRRSAIRPKGFWRRKSCIQRVRRPAPVASSTRMVTRTMALDLRGHSPCTPEHAVAGGVGSAHGSAPPPKWQQGTTSCALLVRVEHRRARTCNGRQTPPVGYPDMYFRLGVSWWDWIIGPIVRAVTQFRNRLARRRAARRRGYK
jgi:hypothetical protein